MCLVEKVGNHDFSRHGVHDNSLVPKSDRVGRHHITNQAERRCSFDFRELALPDERNLVEQLLRNENSFASWPL